jgi:hypothetical protein
METQRAANSYRMCIAQWPWLEILALLGCYAVQTGSYGLFGTTCGPMNPSSRGSCEDGIHKVSINLDMS